MVLDLNHLNVESFETSTPIDVAVPITTTTTVITGKGGPESYCYICYPTGNTDPACQPQPWPETIDRPCTNQLTCVTHCA